MGIEELEKYRTGNRKEKVTIDVNILDNYIFDKYEIPLGDLIKTLIEYKNKPWWKRKYNHKFIENLL